MKQLEHERGGIDRLVSNHALYLLALERADRTDPLVRQEIAELEIGYRIGRLLVIREVLRQAPPGFSAATKLFGTEHEIRVADFIARTLGAQATLWDEVTQGLTYAPGYTIMFKTVDELRPVAQASGVSMATMAMQWVLANPVITSPIVGASRPEQLADSVAAVDSPIDPSVKATLDEMTHEFRFGDNAR